MDKKGRRREKRKGGERKKRGKNEEEKKGVPLQGSNPNLHSTQPTAYCLKVELHAGLPTLTVGF